MKVWTKYIFCILAESPNFLVAPRIPCLRRINVGRTRPLAKNNFLLYTCPQWIFGRLLILRSIISTSIDGRPLLSMVAALSTFFPYVNLDKWSVYAEDVRCQPTAVVSDCIVFTIIPRSRNLLPSISVHFSQHRSRFLSRLTGSFSSGKSNENK